MNPKLAALLVVGVTATIGGTVYLVARVGPGTTRAELLDAGIADCPRVTLECEGRVSTDCEGYSGRRMRTAYVPARSCPQSDGGPPVLVVVPGAKLRQCFELRGSVSEACELVTDGGEADEGDNAQLAPVPDKCWCRARDGGLCRWQGNPDGGLLNMALGNVHRGPVTGVACRRAACAIFAGMSDDDALHVDCGAP